MTDHTLFSAIAEELHAAERSATETDTLVPRYPQLTLADAYEIQKALVASYHSEAVGLKAALTSKAKQRAMNVDVPGFGVLLDWMRCDAELRREGLIHPRVEPEIALHMEDIHLTGRLTAADVASHCTGFSPALEVIDSRYKRFAFTAVDVYADNCSSSRFSVSPDVHPLPRPDLNLLGVVLEKNGEVEQTGTPAAVLGSPFVSAAFVLNQAHTYGVAVPRRFVLLTGGITEAVPVESGDWITATFGGLGAMTLRVV